MSYRTVVEMASNQPLLYRIAACAAEQNEVDPVAWASSNVWHIAADPGWSSSWESAKAGGDNSPGDNIGVITDGMILASVQNRQAELAAAAAAAPQEPLP